MSSRIYTCEFEAQSVTNANGDYELFEFDPGSDRPIELVGLFLGVTSEVASSVAEEEMLRLRIIRGHTTDGTGGASATPRPVDPDDAAATFTCDTLRTAIASAGTAVNLHSDVWNIRMPYQLWWPEGCGPRSSGAALLVVRLMAAVTDDVTMSGTAYVREV